MKFNYFTKLATVSAVALCLAYPIGTANAVLYENGEAIPMDIDAEIINTFDAVVTALDWDVLSVRGDAVDVATATLDVDNNLTEDVGAPGDAAILDTGGTPLAATVVLTLLPAATEITVTYSNLVNVTDGASAFDTAILDNLDAPTLGTGDTAGGIDLAAVNTPGVADSTALGELSFEIGGSLRTQAGDIYAQGVYAGSFDMTVTY